MASAFDHIPTVLYDHVYFPREFKTFLETSEHANADMDHGRIIAIMDGVAQNQQTLLDEEYLTYA